MSAARSTHDILSQQKGTGDPPGYAELPDSAVLDSVSDFERAMNIAMAMPLPKEIEDDIADKKSRPDIFGETLDVGAFLQQLRRQTSELIKKSEKYRDGWYAFAGTPIHTDRMLGDVDFRAGHNDHQLVREMSKRAFAEDLTGLSAEDAPVDIKDRVQVTRSHDGQQPKIVINVF